MGAVTEVREYLKREIPDTIRVWIHAQLQTGLAIQEVMASQEDEAHRMAHIQDTLAIFNSMADCHKLGPADRDLGNRTIRLHDSGYKLVQQGVLRPEEHHYGSMAIASIVDPDLDVLRAIHLHISDILPEDTELWIRLVRDADRLSNVGFGAANRLAYFFGYRDPELEGQRQDTAVNSGVFCDLRHAPQLYRRYSQQIEGVAYLPDGIEDYDLRAAEYYAARVAPYIFESGQSQEYADFIRMMIKRVLGIGDRIEPVNEIGREIYDSRRWASERIDLAHSLYASGGRLTDPVFTEDFGGNQVPDYRFPLYGSYPALRNERARR